MEQTPFSQLAAEAAAGLKADRELYLDVTQELTSHLEDKAERFARDGHSPEESVELAQKAFGSPLDMAAQLLASNRGRMRLRAALRLAFGALVVPLAIVLALYVTYGRLARQAPALSLYQGYERPTVRTLPTLPFFGPYDPSRPAVVRELAGNKMDDASHLLRYWQAHRNDPDGYMYYAHYIYFLQPDSKDIPGYIAALRQGERIEPDNAFYNMLLAQSYLSRGLIAKSEKAEKDKATDELLDRAAFEAGIAELLKMAKKPYWRDYQMQILRKRLDAMPAPLLTEDYLLRISVSASILFPVYAKSRSFARKISGCARILAAEGRAREAEAVLDTWKPITVQLSDGSDAVLIGALVAMAVGATLTQEGSAVYDRLGLHAKAQEARAAREALKQAKARLKDPPPGETNTEFGIRLRQHGSMMVGSLLPVGVDSLPTADLTAGRMVEHVLIEEATVQVAIFLLTLSLLGVLVQGAVWLFKLRRSDAVPLLLMPTAGQIARALLFGIALPALLYWLYSRLPIIGGREFGWGSDMRWRFAAELLGLLVVMLWLPVHLIRRDIRRRCDDLGIALPTKKQEAAAHRVVRAGTLGALAITAGAFFLPGDYDPFWRVLACLIALGLLVLVLRDATRQRGEFGLYYGTLARSLAPVYAFAILVLVLTVQPCLLLQEAHWLKRDKVIYNALTSEPGTVAFTAVELRASRRLSRLIDEAVLGK